MRIINRLKNLSKREKVLIIVFLFLSSLLLGVGIATLLVKNNQSITNQEYNNVSYPVSAPGEGIEIPEDQLSEKIIFNGVDLGLRINNLSNYDLQFSNPVFCGGSEEKDVFILQDFNENNSSVQIMAIHKDLTTQEKFAEYKSRIVDLEFPKRKSTFDIPHKFWPMCVGVQLWDIAPISNRIEGFDNSASYLFLRGIQASSDSTIEDKRIVALLLGYDDTRLVQFEITFKLGDFISEEYKKDCLIDPYKRVSYPTQEEIKYPNIDNDCLTKKLMNDASFIKNVERYLDQKLLEIGFRKPN